MIPLTALSFPILLSAGLLGYGAAHAQESIWNGRSWVVTFKHLFDSVIYAALTTVRGGERCRFAANYVQGTIWMH